MRLLKFPGLKQKILNIHIQNVVCLIHMYLSWWRPGLVEYPNQFSLCLQDIWQHSDCKVCHFICFGRVNSQRDYTGIPARFLIQLPINVFYSLVVFQITQLTEFGMHFTIPCLAKVFMEISKHFRDKTEEKYTLALFWKIPKLKKNHGTPMNTK